jgi:transcriptional regulator with XRE-family HTH domain
MHSASASGSGSASASGSSTPASQLPLNSSDVMQQAERVESFHRGPGGAIMGWLFDEARSRQMTLLEMAAELKVTYGYINQLRNGIRKTEDVNHEFCYSAARFLGVPAIAVKIVAGVVRMSDFLHPAESEETAVERAIRQIQDDPVIRQAVPVDLSALSFEAKKAVALIYVQSSSRDVLGLKELPAIVHWCQRAAALNDDRCFESRAGNGVS